MKEDLTPSQRDMFRSLYKKHGGDQASVIAAYASAERAGQVRRDSNRSKATPEEYARLLWFDAIKKGWHV